MPRHPPKRFDVENEIVWCALDPELRQSACGEGVIARIDLDDREEPGVVLEARFRRRGVLRIEYAWRHERRIRPACGPEANVTLFDVDESRPRSLVVEWLRTYACLNHAGIVQAGLRGACTRHAGRHSQRSRLRSRNCSIEGGTSRLSAILAISSA